MSTPAKHITRRGYIGGTLALLGIYLAYNAPLIALRLYGIVALILAVIAALLTLSWLVGRARAGRPPRPITKDPTQGIGIAGSVVVFGVITIISFPLFGVTAMFGLLAAMHRLPAGVARATTFTQVAHIYLSPGARPVFVAELVAALMLTVALAINLPERARAYWAEHGRPASLGEVMAGHYAIGTREYNRQQGLIAVFAGLGMLAIGGVIILAAQLIPPSASGFGAASFVFIGVLLMPLGVGALLASLTWFG